MTGEGLRGTPPPPLPPPLPPPARERPEGAQRGGGPATPPRGPRHPGGGRHSRGKGGRAPSAPGRQPTHSRSARCGPAALRRRSRAPRGPRRNGDAQECSVEGGAQTKRPALVPARGRRGNTPRQRDLPAPRPAGPSGQAPGRTEHWQPPPSPARLTHRRPARPHPAPGAARQPRLNIYTLGGCAGGDGGLGRGPLATPRGQGGGEARRYPPSPLPPTPPSGLWAAGAPALRPPRGRGDVPPPTKGAAAPEGDAGEPARRAAPCAPTPALAGAATGGGARASHKKGARTVPGGGTRTRTGAVWRPSPPIPERRQ